MGSNAFVRRQRVVARGKVNIRFKESGMGIVSLIYVIWGHRVIHFDNLD